VDHLRDEQLLGNFKKTCYDIQMNNPAPKRGISMEKASHFPCCAASRAVLTD